MTTLTAATEVVTYAFSDGLGIETVEPPSAGRSSQQQAGPIVPTTNTTTTATATKSNDKDGPSTLDSVLISGGSRGIGRVIASRLSANGAKVATLARSGSDSYQDGILDLAADITDQSSIDLAVKRAVEENGPITTLVCNAGITDDGLFLRMSEDSFQSVLDTNLLGSYRLVKSVIGPMLRARSGRIVLMSSVVAFSGSAGQANYAASKAGLVGMARSMAREFGPRSVTCNVVSPGFVATDMTAELTDARRDEVMNSIPLGRMADPDDIAKAVEFLASDAAAYVTGAVIPVDGGLGMGH